MQSAAKTKVKGLLEPVMISKVDNNTHTHPQREKKRERRIKREKEE